MLKFLLVLLIAPAFVFGSCTGPFPSITEVLNHNDKNIGIFTCTILKTYIRNSDYESIAVVNDRFNNIHLDTVYINSGGFTMAGGQKLIPGSEWLIFGFTRDNLHYNATVCEYNSTLIKSNNPIVNRSIHWDKGRDYLRIVKEYEKIKTSKFTGYKIFYINNNKVAEGYYKKGKAHGKWIHYSRFDQFESNKIKSIINYDNGVLDGDYLDYSVSDDDNFIISTKRYKSDKILYHKIYKGGKTEYTYVNSKDRISKKTFIDKNGKVYKIVNQYEKDYNGNTYFKISYKTGYYFNKSPYSGGIHGEGHYYRGAKVGAWKYFTNDGEFLKSEFYEYPDTTNKDFVVFDENGIVIISGKIEGTKRVGVWKRYNTLITYDMEGNLLNEYTIRDDGQKIFTPYKNFKKHGNEIVFSKNNMIKRITPYKNGRKSGTYLSYDDDGNIIQEIYYYKNRKTTRFNRKKDRSYINGYLEGDYMQLDSKGKILSKGTYWKGYLIGEQIKYEKDGSYYINTYSTDTIKLMSDFFEMSPISTKKYDKNGNLLKSWKN